MKKLTFVFLTIAFVLSLALPLTAQETAPPLPAIALAHSIGGGVAFSSKAPWEPAAVLVYSPIRFAVVRPAAMIDTQKYAGGGIEVELPWIKSKAMSDKGLGIFLGSFYAVKADDTSNKVVRFTVTFDWSQTK